VVFVSFLSIDFLDESTELDNQQLRICIRIQINQL